MAGMWSSEAKFLSIHIQWFQNKGQKHWIGTDQIISLHFCMSSSLFTHFASFHNSEIQIPQQTPGRKRSWSAFWFLSSDIQWAMGSRWIEGKLSYEKEWCCTATAVQGTVGSQSPKVLQNHGGGTEGCGYGHVHTEEGWWKHQHRPLK